MNYTLARQRGQKTIQSASVPTYVASCATEYLPLSTQAVDPGNANARCVEIRLIRKSELLKKIQISKSTLHAKLDPRSRYYDPTFPRPRYLNGSRIPLWSLHEVEMWLAGIFASDSGGHR